jgi:hypothetical protein
VYILFKRGNLHQEGNVRLFFFWRGGRNLARGSSLIPATAKKGKKALRKVVSSNYWFGELILFCLIGRGLAKKKLSSVLKIYKNFGQITLDALVSVRLSVR